MNNPGPSPSLNLGGLRMTRTVILVTASLLSILLMTVHLTQDAVHAKVGNPEAGGSTLIAVPILVAWLYGTVMLAERRSGYIIMLVGSVIALGMPIIHAKAAAGFFQGQLANRADAFWFVWTLHALGVLGMFCLILSAQGLWSWRRDHAR
jgi:hypothetical protein